MTQITLETTINAPIEKVFHLSLDIDFHKKSASQTREEAISVITSGQIHLGETVTWQGKHFGLWLTHTSIISAYKAPFFFVDEMTEGNFKSFRHEHHFCKPASTAGSSKHLTIMTDILTYKVPYGLIGKAFNNFVLKKHLTKFLTTRNLALKNTLESSKKL